MSWFKRHLNWTLWLVTICAWLPFLGLGNANEVLLMFMVIMAIMAQVAISIWYLSQKGRSYWYMLTMPSLGIFILLCLSNKRSVKV